MAKRSIIIGLDIGTGSIKSLAVQRKVKESELEVLAASEENSFGVRKGVVVEPNQVANLIQMVIRKNEEQAGQKIDSVYVNVGGGHIFSVSSRGLVSVSRADQKISAEDIERVVAAAQTFPLPSNREILEVFPREFIIDGEKGIKEALGMTGVRLEAEVLMLGGFAPYLKNLTTAVLNSGLQINSMILSPLASARAVLTPREKELGVVLLDIGAGTTDMAVFEEGGLVHGAILPVGSSHITQDIAIFLKSDIDIAERIKLEFGTLFFQGKDKKEKIKLSDEETLNFSRRQLAKIIEDRISDIFGEVGKELKKIGKRQFLPSGIVLTGGGAKLPKIRDFAKKELRLPCRIGNPLGFDPIQDDPRFSTVCGLVLGGADLEEEDASHNGFSISKSAVGSKLKKLFKIFIP